MKILFFTTYYPPFLKQFYVLNSDFLFLSYDQMLKRLLEMHFADTGAAFHYAKESGNEVFLIIANCEPLQKKWAAENNVTFTEKNWPMEIAGAQIKSFRPDVLFIESVFEFYGDFIASVKDYCKRIVAWISTPFSEHLKLNNIDLILTSTPAFITDFRAKGIDAEYLLPAFDTRILKLLPDHKKDINFSFVGGWSDIHVNRKKALLKLVKNSSIQLWGYGYKKTKISKRKINYYLNLFLPENREILERYNGEIWGIDMYSILQRSVVTFNIHESLLKGKVGNMRMFEATGVGTMILNDNGTNLADLFIPGKEIETYANLDEAIEKSIYYSEHPEKAIAIGKNAQLRTIKDYNYINYMDQLNRYLRKII